MPTIPTFADLRGELAKNWQAMSIDPANRAFFSDIAARLYRNIAIYRSIERVTGVPASMIAVIHEREASGDMKAYLGNGEPLSKVTTLVPAGRGPFGSFTEGALDALKLDGLTAVRNWSLERMLYHLEAYNGWGYRWYHPAVGGSPYVWARTSIYRTGKYVSDGKFDSAVKDVQPGCAGILAALWTLDPSLRVPMEGQPRQPAQEISLEPPTLPPDVPLPLPRPTPPPITPAQGALGGVVVAVLTALAMFWQQVRDWITHIFGG